MRISENNLISTVRAKRGVVFNRRVHWESAAMYQIKPIEASSSEVGSFEAISQNPDDPLQSTQWGRYIMTKDIYLPDDASGFGFPISGMIFQVLEDYGPLYVKNKSKSLFDAF